MTKLLFATLAVLVLPCAAHAQITPLVSIPFGDPFPVTATYALHGGTSGNSWHRWRDE